MMAQKNKCLLSVSCLKLFSVFIGESGVRSYLHDPCGSSLSSYCHLCYPWSWVFAPVNTKVLGSILKSQFLLTSPDLCVNFLLTFMKFLSLLAAAKSLQSCLTLCNPIDGSPPGSPIPGILRARTLEWVAISFSNA